MGVPGFPEALQVLRQDAGGDVHRMLAAACGPVPAWDPVVYLADFSRTVLFPLTPQLPPEQVTGTLAGRAFTTGQPATGSPEPGGQRIWVPVLEQTACTGVLALTVSEASEQALAQAQLLGVFAGLVTAVAVRVSDIPNLRRLHDVGKIGIPDGILLKPGRLNSSERRRMQTHAELGERLLAHVPLLNQEGARVIRSHHERWDGTGYPDRLAERAIPMGARIFAVVDALDAMTDTRPYRTPVSWDAAAEEIRRCRGTHFDPDVVDGFEACEADLYRLHTAECAAA